METILENGASLEVSAIKKQADFGIAYWQARYTFLTTGSARFHGTTFALYASEQAAEEAAMTQARREGWGRGPSC